VPPPARMALMMENYIWAMVLGGAGPPARH